MGPEFSLRYSQEPASGLYFEPDEPSVYHPHFPLIFILILYYIYKGARGSVVVKALCYKQEGRVFGT
jgi:hypothetical protein